MLISLKQWARLLRIFLAKKENIFALIADYLLDYLTKIATILHIFKFQSFKGLAAVKRCYRSNPLFRTVKTMLPKELLCQNAIFMKY
ncbi:hypothetical protein A9299_05490 [Moraxella osloensis]|uniref:Uncharacterized protein n=1 Tax=Faucicola osloensis TaxID=34062 RepID=A0AA91FGB0_FAUOS|nr:hypothetical protein A9299_05490 [Moraxella osloensis]